MWVKVWTTDDRKMSSNYGFHEVADHEGSNFSSDENSPLEILHDLECRIGPLRKDVSIHWGKVDVIPNDVIDKEIAKAKRRIKYSEKRVTQIINSPDEEADGKFLIEVEDSRIEYAKSRVQKLDKMRPR